jgi:PAS domain S-box-containing protein
VVVSSADSNELRLAEARLRILLAATATAASRASLDDACRSIAQVICEELDWDFVGIWTVPVGTWALRCSSTWWRPGFDFTAFERGARAASLAPGVGLPGRAWASRKVEWYTEEDTDARAPAANRPRTIMPPSALAAGLRSGFVVPVRCAEDVLAVIEILGSQRHAADRVLSDLLDAIGVQVALAELRTRAETRSEMVQRELEEASEKLEAVMASVPAFITTIDRDDKILFVNRTWSHLRKERVVGASWREIVEPARQALMAAALKKVFDDGAHESYEVVALGPGGKSRWLSSHISPMRIGGQIAAAIVISQDVTESKLAETNLAEAQRLAGLGTLLAGVAHEINTPIQFVGDSVQFLRQASDDVLSLVTNLEVVHRLVVEGAAPAELDEAAADASAAIEQADLLYLREHVPKAFASALDGLDRMATIVRSMKEFAHPAQKHMAPVDLNRAIMSTLTVAKGEFKYVADLETTLAELPPVVCHVNEINQVVLNIVVNAAHAIGDLTKGTERKGAIKIRTEHQDDRVVISISDTGGGIPEDVRDRIFDPFFTTKEVGRGTGQGLAIARTIVKEKHGGDLTFETELGVGTTFFIRLPIAGKPVSTGLEQRQLSERRPADRPDYQATDRAIGKRRGG